jgi:D-tyrosyl-tRNA(Tyr) deacylase
MRAVVQRVSSASVEVDGEISGQIGRGILVLVGIHDDDTLSDIRYVANKCLNLRIFNDENGRMNHSVLETGGQVLLVSQFTLYGNTTKGRRPSYNDAAAPDKARQLFEQVVDEFRLQIPDVQTGRFQEHMNISLVNDGPVTLLVESPR